MKKYEGKLVGILGTVIVHLVIAIIIMSFQIRSLQIESRDMFEIEFVSEEEIADEEKLIEVPITSIEKILQGDEEMLNIARNLASRADPTISPDEYIDMVKEELMKSGKLGSDNYIDEQRRLAEQGGDEKLSFKDSEAEKKDNSPSESQEMASSYKGPTRIYYDLEGRIHTWLPLPIYKCQGAGKVVLRIEVNQNGIVEKSTVIAGQSSTSDPCLVEAAVKTAVLSRFNSDINSPRLQTGTLTYHFVAQ